MKRLLTTLIAFIAVAIIATAQKLEVKTFKKDLTDPAATQFPVKDLNGQNCALIIVGLAVDGAEFEGNIIKQERKPNGEYWVYITDGSMDFQINSKGYLPEPVTFASLGITSVEGGATYRMNVEHPNLEKTFDELYEIADGYMKEYPGHADFGYFEAAQLALKTVFEHNDCPADTRESVRARRDTMLSIRNNVYLVEAAVKKTQRIESERGFEDAEVYKTMGAEMNYLNRLLTAHPEMTAVAAIKNRLTARVQNHPLGRQKTGEDIVMHQREKLSGTVSFKSKYISIPFNRMKIYATSRRDIKDGESRIIGKVNDDGTYSVVKPDGMNPLYVYVTGEKNEAHYVPQGTTHLDIIIKTNK